MEFAPTWGRTKPVTKSQIRKLQAAYAQSDEMAKENREREEMEKWAVNEEMEDLLNGI